MQQDASGEKKDDFVYGWLQWLGNTVLNLSIGSQIIIYTVDKECVNALHYVTKL